MLGFMYGKLLITHPLVAKIVSLGYGEDFGNISPCAGG